MRNIKISFPTIFCMLLASCNLINFSEDCTYYGDVEIKPDWSVLEKGEIKPVLTDIHLLSQQKNYSYYVSADTLVKDVQTGNYKALAFNSYQLPDISLSGMDSPNTAKAELSTSEENGRLYTVQAPALYAANADLTVIPYQRVVCEPVFKSAVRQINIDFVVVGNTDIGISSIKGELSGISYQYGFKQLDQLESVAWLSFGTEVNTDKSNVFSSTLKVFGVNPDKQSIERIDNLLDIDFQTTDGEQHTETIDLTDVFSGFTTRIINITIEIRLSLMGIEVAITGWNVSDGGTIEL